MTVHVLIPVFNRLAMTRRVIDCLHLQQADEPINIIVIDDGSSDGTAEFLQSQADITTLKGDGNLWWGGAIQLGLLSVLKRGQPGDYVLMINNDTHFEPDFVQRLLDTARQYAPAAVGSVICDETAPETVLSIGAVLDTWRLRVRDKLGAPRPRDRTLPPHQVDALSGRGTLYPLSAFKAAGTMRTKRLPHYLADYELAVRVRKANYKLLVTETAAVLSADDYGNARKASTLWDKFFSVRSSSYLPAVLTFWWEASANLLERALLLPRLFYVTLAGPRSSS